MVVRTGGVSNAFPIGVAGQPWGDAEREEWRATRKVQRSYKEEVTDKLEQLDPAVFEVVQYGGHHRLQTIARCAVL